MAARYGRVEDEAKDAATLLIRLWRGRLRAAPLLLLLRLVVINRKDVVKLPHIRRSTRHWVDRRDAPRRLIDV